jgi:DNA-binding transcriptional ArsR family regulator
MDDQGLDRATAEAYASAYRCLADPTRLLLLNRLARARRPLQVGEIVSLVDVSQSTVSHHLRILRDGGFVRVTHEGPASLFEVNPECLGRFPATAAVILDQAAAGAETCTTCDGQGFGPVSIGTPAVRR